MQTSFQINDYNGKFDFIFNNYKLIISARYVIILTDDLESQSLSANDANQYMIERKFQLKYSRFGDDLAIFTWVKAIAIYLLLNVPNHVCDSWSWQSKLWLFQLSSMRNYGNAWEIGLAME